jgi:5-dehydro-4-deoxyglucarate dehydratase
MTVADELRKRLSGVIGGPVSPFRADLSLDYAALERNVAATLKYPFPALLIAAGIAEFHSLALEEVEESVRVALVAAAGRSLVIGTVGVNVEVGRRLARNLEKAGAGALLVMPPYYPNAAEGGLAAYYEGIGRSTGLPLIIYSRDWVAPSPELVARLAERIPNLAAWKDGQGDVRRYQRMMSIVGDRLIWLGGSGDDAAPGYFAIGVQGYTSSISNFLPKLAIAMAKAGAARDFAELNRLVNRYVHPLYRLREKMRGYDVAVLKLAMEMFGIAAGPVRPPLPAVAAEVAAELRGLRGVFEEMR